MSMQCLGVVLQGIEASPNMLIKMFEGVIHIWGLLLCLRAANFSISVLTFLWFFQWNSYHIIAMLMIDVL